jgi:hypothetical protein
MALTRFASLETFRLAVFLCMIPFCAVRASKGSAARNAASALARSPDLIASSTLRTSVFTRERRPLLTSVRRIIWRAAFFADDVLAMDVSLCCFETPLRTPKGEERPRVEKKCLMGPEQLSRHSLRAV